MLGLNRGSIEVTHDTRQLTSASTSVGPLPASSSRTQPRIQPHQEAHTSSILVEQPDRVTLHPPMQHFRSPFARYYHIPEEAPRPSSLEAAARRLNLPPEELQARIEEEIDGVLRESVAERRIAHLFSAPPPLQRPLSKQDCLDLFEARGYPTSGPLYGVYLWAADIECDSARDADDYDSLNDNF